MVWKASLETLVVSTRAIADYSATVWWVTVWLQLANLLFHRWISLWRGSGKDWRESVKRKGRLDASMSEQFSFYLNINIFPTFRQHQHWQRWYAKEAIPDDGKSFISGSFNIGLIPSRPFAMTLRSPTSCIYFFITRPSHLVTHNLPFASIEALTSPLCEPIDGLG